MNDRRIVICGGSIYMLAIESGLSSTVEGDVVRVNPYLPNIVDRISELEPHVVIIELDGEISQLVVENLQRSIPIIFLDEARGSIRVLTRENLPNAEVSEVTSLIEKINRQQEISSGESIIQPEEQ